MREVCVQSVSEALGRPINARQGNAIEAKILNAMRTEARKDIKAWRALSYPERIQRAAEVAGQQAVDEAKSEPAELFQSRNKSPKVKMVRGGDRYHFSSKNGLINARAQSNNRVFKVDGSGVDEPAQGTGEGMALYEAALEQSKKLGRILVSDRTVSDQASNIYAALARRGYKVLRSAEPKRYGDSYRQAGDGGPLFAVLPPNDPRTWRDVMADYYGVDPSEFPEDTAKYGVEIPAMSRTEMDALPTDQRQELFQSRDDLDKALVPKPERSGRKPGEDKFDIRKPFDVQGETDWLVKRVRGLRPWADLATMESAAGHAFDKGGEDYASVIAELRKRFGGSELFQGERELDPMGFYSAALEGAKALPETRWGMGVNAVLASIEKGTGFKGWHGRVRDEMDTIGLREAFKGSKLKGADLKAAVLEYIQTNRLVLNEVSKRFDPNLAIPDPSEIVVRRDPPGWRASVNGRDVLYVNESALSDDPVRAEAQMREAAQYELESDKRDNAREMRRGPGQYDLDRFSPIGETVLSIPAPYPGHDVPGSHTRVKGDLLNILWGEKVDDKGGKTLFVRQLQSDIAQQQRVGKVEIDEIERDIANVKAEIEKRGPKTDKEEWRERYDAAKAKQAAGDWLDLTEKALFQIGDDPVAGARFVDRNIRPVQGLEHRLMLLGDRLREMKEEVAPLTGVPLTERTSQWTGTGVRAMVIQAARRGFDSFSIPTGETSERIQGNDAASEHYETNVKAALEKVARSLGGEVREGSVKVDGDGEREAHSHEYAMYHVEFERNGLNLTVSYTSLADANAKAAELRASGAEKIKVIEPPPVTNEASAYVMDITPEMRTRILGEGFTLFQSRGAPRAPTFFSALSRVVEASKTGKASAAQWKATLAKTPGLKKEELEFTGVNDWLDAQDGPVSREALSDFISQNGVQVQEVVKGGGSALTNEQQTQRLAIIEEADRLRAERDRMDATIERPNKEQKARLAEIDARLTELLDQIAPLNQIIQQAAEAHGGRVSGKDRVKWSQYALPGAVPGSYRELLLVLPVKVSDAAADAKKATAASAAAEREVNEKIAAWYRALPEAERNPRGPVPAESPYAAEWAAMREGIGNVSNWQRNISTAGKDTFKSSHWDEPNVLAHVRFDERVDANGSRTLFLEEVQSDAHQKGREQGYRPTVTKEDRAIVDAAAKELGLPQIATGDDLVKAYRSGFLSNIKDDKLKESLDRFVDAEDARRIPNLPFKNNSWASLTLKRMIRYASENGFDQIAWTPGHVQIDRYNLSHVLGDVDAVKQADGRVSFTPSNGRRDARQVLQQFGEPGKGGDTIMTREQALEAFGADAGARLFDGATDKGRKFSGDDLKVGGSGMTAFYDKILPNIANDIGKKYGAKVGETVIHSFNEADGAPPEGRDLEELARNGHPNAHTVHALPLSPSLKSQALEEGFPLFQDRSAAGPRGSIQLPSGGLNNGHAIINLFESSNPSTMLHEFGHYALHTYKAIAELPDAPPEIVRDLQAIRDWMGAVPGENWTVEQDELFARTFEAYLMKGEAPSIDLRSAFAAFKSWLVQLYRSALNLNANLTPEIKDVMDRMLASEEQIQAAQKDAGQTQAFTSQAESGMSDAKWASYQKIQAQAHEEAETDLRVQAMDAYLRQQKVWWGRAKAKMRRSVEREIDEEPIRRAYEWLGFERWKGEIPRKDRHGEPAEPAWGKVDPPDGLEPMRLSARAVAEDYGPEALAKLPAALAPIAASRVESLVDTAKQTKRALKRKEPKRLATFVRSNGGVSDEGGDLESSLGSYKNHWGVINKKSGISIDDMARKAWEAGYFGKGPGEQNPGDMNTLEQGPIDWLRRFGMGANNRGILARIKGAGNPLVEPDGVIASWKNPNGYLRNLSREEPLPNHHYNNEGASGYGAQRGDFMFTDKTSNDAIPHEFGRDGDALFGLDQSGGLKPFSPDQAAYEKARLGQKGPDEPLGFGVERFGDDGAFVTHPNGETTFVPSNMFDGGKASDADYIDAAFKDAASRLKETPDQAASRASDLADALRGVIKDKPSLGKDIGLSPTAQASARWNVDNPIIKGGKDELFQSAEDDGRPTPRQFLDALIDDVKGNVPSYRAQDETDVASRAEWEKWAEWFARHGVDIEADVKTVRAQLRAAIQQEDNEGVHPDVAAEAFGFSSGDELLKALGDMVSRETAIRQEVDKRMLGEYGDPMRDGTFAEEARLSAHGEARARAIEIELEALQRATGGVKAPTRFARQEAQRQLQRFTIKQIKNPDWFLAAERRASKAAADELAKGNKVQAAFHKQRQLLSFWLYREAREAKAKIESTEKRWGRLANSDGVRQKIDADYLDKIDAVLDGYEIRKSRQGNKQRWENSRLLDWLDEMKGDPAQADLVSAIDPRIIADARKRAVNTLLYDEFNGLKDTLANLEHLGRLKDKLLTAQDKRTFNETIKGFQDRVAQEWAKRAALPLSLAARNPLEAAIDGAADLHGAQVKMEFLLRYMDGIKDGGPWSKAFMPASQRAESAELQRGHVEAANFKHLLSVYTPKELGQMLLKKVWINEIADNLTKMQMIGVALNRGNAYNWENMQAGFGWSDQRQAQAILDKLDKRDWDFVQSVWDYLETFKGEDFAIARKLTGVTPVAVEATPFTNKHGAFRGGYYPVKFDSELSTIARRRAVQEAMEGTLGAAPYRRAAVNTGATKERVGTGGQPFSLDPISIISQSVKNSIHRITHREFVFDAQRMVSDPRVLAMLRSVLGRQGVEVAEKWVKKIATPDPTPADAFERVMGKVRNNVTVVNMGWKITTAIMQELGKLQAIPRNGILPTLKQGGITLGRDYPVFLGRQVARLFGAPETLPARIQFIFDRSPFMKSLYETYDRDVKSAQDEHLGGKHGIIPNVVPEKLRPILKQAKDSMFILSQLMNLGSSVPAWLAAYENALGGKVDGLAQGDEQAAVEHGDAVVRMTQGVGAPKDLSALMADNNQFLRLMTMFMTWANTYYNQMAMEQIPGVIHGKISKARFAANMLFTWFIPAYLTLLFYGTGNGGAGDDDDAVAKVLAVMTYPLQTIPIIRDAINAYVTGYDYKMSPVEAAFQSPVKVAKAVETGDGRKITKALVESSGYFMGLPTKQMWISGSYAADVASGKEDPVNDPGSIVSEGLLQDKR